jgi:uncharacterized cofD-like protein
MAYPKNNHSPVKKIMRDLSMGSFSPLDMLRGRTLPEKLTDLALSGAPEGPPLVVAGLKHLASELKGLDVSQVKVVVFGGGTGLSTIIGGDSRSMAWMADPFCGLKAIFPQTRAIVCVTDDGGSTGELQKDLPLIGLGDLRHVLLSLIQVKRLRRLHKMDEVAAMQIAARLFVLFNYRYKKRPASVNDLLGDGALELDKLPDVMASGILELIKYLFVDCRLTKTLVRPHCLGNLLITSAIYRCHKGGDEAPAPEAVRDGLRFMTELLGVSADAVLPCTTTPSKLKMLYTNGVSVSGEHKSGLAQRGYPVDRVSIDFVHNPPAVLPEVIDSIGQADIIIFAPGSLYTSIVPVMQVPGLAQAVRKNRQALKVLVSNLWAQAGETDLVADAPHRRFYVSDLLKAYQHNIPGGVEGLFQQIVLLKMKDIPGSILQSYAVEGKMPIYLDRERVCDMGFLPLEAGVFSPESLADNSVKHDPTALALTMKTMWAARDISRRDRCQGTLSSESTGELATAYDRCRTAAERPLKSCGEVTPACERLAHIRAKLADLQVEERQKITDILWHHADIPAAHLDYIHGLHFVKSCDWRRCQEWDNIYSFFNPDDGFLNIREDMRHTEQFEVAFLVALGQSLLGNYVTRKEISPLEVGDDKLGKIYRLNLRSTAERACFLSDTELRQYLVLARMMPTGKDAYTRLLNGDEGFTPPGLLFGLTYAWYIDNRFAPHIEYKMAIARAAISDAVPEQVKTLERRRGLVDFFRNVVFGR